MEKGLKIIGRVAEVDFPGWDLYGLKAKVDTGAYTSSLHCHSIKEIKEEGGESRVRFRLLDPSHDSYQKQSVEMPVTRRKKVRSSNGTTEERIFIKASLFLLEQELEGEFSLNDRSDMRYPVLLGRKLLRGRFLVDVTRSL